jgi:hypothetical protein
MTRCRLCRSRPAAVPDRNIMGRPIKRICFVCHQQRLLDDLEDIMLQREQERKERAKAMEYFLGRHGPPEPPPDQ